VDLAVGPSGAWEWASCKPELHRWAADYFRLRNEDGNGTPAGCSLFGHLPTR
jgi:hypothetical protein